MTIHDKSPMATQASDQLDQFNQSHQRMIEITDQALEQYTRYDDSVPASLGNAIRHSLLAPAKRLRPTLVLMANEVCGGDLNSAIPAAVAVEMIHTYSLIHDDLPSMDDDDLRRGQPSCHVKFGEAAAILAGDALLAQAFSVLSENLSPPEIAHRCVLELANAAGPGKLVGGQIADLEGENRDDLTLVELEAIHRRKTGAMIRVSLRLGGLIANADESTLKKLTIFGENIGLAFQIVDDLLDFCGDQTKMGKSLGKDSQAEKLTYVKLFGLEESREKATRLIDQSIATIDDLGSPAIALQGLARFILNRTC